LVTGISWLVVLPTWPNTNQPHWGVFNTRRERKCGETIFQKIGSSGYPPRGSATMKWKERCTPFIWGQKPRGCPKEFSLKDDTCSAAPLSSLSSMKRYRARMKRKTNFFFLFRVCCVSIKTQARLFLNEGARFDYK
jgi:hypothetical protein